MGGREVNRIEIHYAHLWKCHHENHYNGELYVKEKQLERREAISELMPELAA